MELSFKLDMSCEEVENLKCLCQGDIFLLGLMPGSRFVLGPLFFSVLLLPSCKALDSIAAKRIEFIQASASTTLNPRALHDYLT